MPAWVASLCLALGLAPIHGLEPGRLPGAVERLRLELRLRGPALGLAPAGRIDQLSPLGLELLLRRAPRAPSARLAELSGRFLGVPYLLSPLGEGPGHPPDEDPLLRLDAVDCTTFVEQVLAFARAGSLRASLAELRRIRYRGGRMEFHHRKHDMLAQWLPDLQRLGVLEDVTVLVGGKDVVWVEQRYDPALWAGQAPGSLWRRLPAGSRPAGLHRLPILPVGRALAHSAALPDGTLLNVVRCARPGRVTRVTHQGLVVRVDGRLYLRHARRGGAAAVVDEPLASFVARNLAYRKWVVEGFNLQRVLLPGGT